MAISIEVLSFTQTGETSFEAHGNCEGEAFLAKTIIYKGEPIFKVQEIHEDGELRHLRMKDSSWTRGQRIAIAARLKAIRLGKVEGPTELELAELTAKELRAKCKAAGLSGYHAKGVRKADLVAMLQAA